MPAGGIMLDSLLMAAVAVRDRLPPVTVQRVDGIDIPVKRSACGRLYLCSEARPAFDEHEQRFQNRRHPLVESLRLSAMNRVDIALGPERSYRIPYTASHVEGDRLEWWAVGEDDGVRALLGLVHGLGRRRAAGYGRVLSWTVEPCEAWPGFPVMRSGRPLRPLPMDWPGVTDAAPAYRTLLPPYWDRAREEECWAP